mmetsp:Transcript_25990/g.41630  ORF Transcript_25990/g.41630 Transcript_25990/m.41630 type:complete len:489 (+) Transcript_25990:60-1526(+)
MSSLISLGLLNFLLLLFILLLLFVGNAIHDILLHLLALLLPHLHLLLVLLQLGLELLKQGWHIGSGDGCIELELVEEDEGLCVVLDGLGGGAGLTRLLLGSSLALLALGGRKEVLFLAVLLPEEHLLAVLVVVGNVLLLLLLLTALGRDKRPAEKHALLDQGHLGHERLLVQLLQLALLAAKVVLLLAISTLLVHLLLALLALLVKVCVEFALCLAELIADGVALLDQRSNLLADLLALAHDFRQVTKLLLAALHELRHLLLHLLLGVPVLGHFLVDRIALLLTGHAGVECGEVVLHLLNLGNLRAVFLEQLDFLDVVLLLLQGDGCCAHPVLDGRNAVINLLLTSEPEGLLHVFQIIAHGLAFLALLPGGCVDLVFLGLQLIHLAAELIQLSTQLRLLGEELILSTRALVDLGRKALLLLLQLLNALLDLGNLGIELLTIRSCHLALLLLLVLLLLLGLGLGLGLGLSLRLRLRLGRWGSGRCHLSD